MKMDPSICLMENGTILVVLFCKRDPKIQGSNTAQPPLNLCNPIISFNRIAFNYAILRTIHTGTQGRVCERT